MSKQAAIKGNKLPPGDLGSSENNSAFTLESCTEWFSKTNPIWYIIEDTNRVGYIRTNKDEVGIDIHPMYRRMGVSTRLTQEREKIAIEYACTKIDYIADVSLEFSIPDGYIRKEVKGKRGFRYEKDLTPYLNNKGEIK